MIGAFWGYLMAGPMGALFGILIGNFFDRGLSEHFSRPHWSYYAEKKTATQKIFFDATFTIMGHIAKVDGRVSEQEIEMARRLMKELRLTKKQESEAQSCFNRGKQPDFDLQHMLTILQKELRHHPALLKLFIDLQYRAAQIDGLSHKKQQVINTILLEMGFAPLNRQYRFYEDFGNDSSHQKTRQQYSSSGAGYQQKTSSSKGRLEHAYAILGVSPNTNKQDLKRAYRQLMSRNHPDKLIAKGLPEAMIKIANEKTQAISKAYTQICESRGW
jgi:DnaJ like chaperone protein